MLHIRGKLPPMSAEVNLDALIKREDLFKMSDDESGLNEMSDTKVLRIDADLTPGKSYFFKTLRKADFQRETSEWKPERIVGLIKSFINGDIIPSIILWNWKGLNYIIDGGHRLSALVAWISDDYGDKEISQAYFGAENITKEQKKNAADTRKLIEAEIGGFKSYEHAFLNEGKVPQEQTQKARTILVTRSIPVQWINAHTSKDAEKSFFRINGEATPIDETEAVILKSREKPNAIAARAIIHSGNAHKYWKNFNENIQNQIESIATKINDLLFEPQLDEKTSHFPIGGKEYSKQSVELVFGIINMINNLDEINFKKKAIYKKEADEIPPAKDLTGEDTISYLKNVQRVVSILSANDSPISLGLAPLVYFYNNKGKFQITSFLAIIHLVYEWDKIRMSSTNDKTFQKFCAIRDRFEKFLLVNKIFTSQATINIGSGIKSYKRLSEVYLFVINEMLKGTTDEEIINMIKQNPSFGFIKLFAAADEFDETRNPPGTGKIPKQTQNQIIISKYFQIPDRCPRCGGYYTFYSYNFDHDKKRSEGGTNEIGNLELTHIYCNEERDEIKKIKDLLSSHNENK